MPIIKMVCSRCGSEDVLKDAYAEWSIENQCWELRSVFDYTICDACGAEDCVEERPIEEGAKREPA